MEAATCTGEAPLGLKRRYGGVRAKTERESRGRREGRESTEAVEREREREREIDRDREGMSGRETK